MKKLILYLFLALCAQLPAQVQMFFTPDTYSGVENPHDVDSLFYWFAADIGVLDSVGSPIENDDGVGTWPDLSGNGYNTTQSVTANRPTWLLNGGPNNRPAVSFDGTNDFLASAAHWWGSDDLTIFVVMKFGNETRATTEIMIARTQGGTNQLQFNLFGRSDAGFNLNSDIYQSGTGTPVSINRFSSKSTSYRVIALTNTGAGAATANINGASSTVDNVGTGNGTIFDTSIALMLGAGNAASPNSFLLGSISEIIVYSRALTAGEREAIEAYLNQKYKLY